MGVMSVQYSHRPIRVGWVVPSTVASVQRAMELSHMFLGGRYNPIIPADDPRLAESLIDLFSPDVVWPVSEAQAVSEVLARNVHLKWPGIHNELFVGRERGPAAAQLLDVSHAILALEPRNDDERTRLELSAMQLTWADDDPLASILMAMFGRYSDPDHGAEYGRLFSELLSPAVARVAASSAIPADFAHSLVPSNLSVQLLNPVRAPRGDIPGIYLGDAGAVEDLIAFWNIRAAGIRVAFVDPKHTDRLHQFVAAHLDRLTTQGQPSIFGGPGVWSRDRSSAVPEELGDRPWKRCAVSGATWNGLNLRPAQYHLGRDSALANVDEVGRGVRLTFDSKASIPTFREIWARQQHAALAIATPRLHGRSDSATFYTPDIPKLSPFYSRTLPLVLEELRPESGALSLLLPLWQHAHITLQSLPAEDLVAAVFGTGGLSASPSKAGRIARRIITQLGGIQGARVFMISGVRDLLSRRRSAGIPRGDVQGAISRSLTPHKHLFIRARPTAELTEAEVLGYLTDKRILRLGSNVRCSACELDSWLPLERFRTVVRCPLCDSRFNASHQFVQKTSWHYRTSGLFGRADNQEGAIPVLLALRALDTVLGNSFADVAFATSMDVTLPGEQGASQTREVDLVYLSAGRDGVTQIALGECKAKGPTDKRDINGLTRIADRITSSRIHPFLLFAKTTQFTEEEIELMRPPEGTWPRRTIILGPDWLEAYDFRLTMTEATSGRFLGDGMEELAELTYYRYFDTG